MPSTPPLCSYSVLNHGRDPLLQTLTLSTAPETDAERTQRHLALCRALADHGMKLVEAAAEQAVQALTGKPAEFSRYSHLFTRLSHAVRQAIALELRIINGPKPCAATRPAETDTPASTPGVPRPPSPGRARTERLDANFDSAEDAEIPSLLAAIGAELGVSLPRPARPSPEPPQTAAEPIPTPKPRPAPAHQPNRTPDHPTWPARSPSPAFSDTS